VKQKRFFYGLREWPQLFLLLIGLLGCKPKETTVSGQIFTSTPLGNVKLGDAQIFLIEKPQVVEFLQKKKATISSERAARNRDVETAQKELMQATSDYTNFLTTRPFVTDSDYIRITSERDGLLHTVATLEQKYEPLRLRSDELRKAARAAISERTPEFVYMEYKANSIFLSRWNNVQLRSHQPPLNEPTEFKSWRVFLEAAQQEMSETMAQVHQLENERESLETRLSEIERLAEAQQTNRISIAKARVVTTRAAKLKYPGDLDKVLFTDFPIATARKAISEADGKFIVSYPQKKAFALFAKAEWKSKNESLTYYWFVDAPLNMALPCILSNSKLTSVDPDGYLKNLKELGK
jgi:hypothetical protein